MIYYNIFYGLPCVDVEQGSLSAGIMLAPFSKAAAIFLFGLSGLSLIDLRALLEINLGRFFSLRRLNITASVFAFQYARSINGTIKEIKITVKFLYQMM